MLKNRSENPLATGWTRRGFTQAAFAAGAMLAAPSSVLRAAPADALGRYDATALADRIRSGEVTALDLVDAAIARFERFDSTLNTVVAERFDAAREAAKQYTDHQAPFAGVPYLLKDLIEYPGLPFRSGSRLFAHNMSDWRSDYVAATEAAGLIVLGKSTTPEFGLIPATEPLVSGATLNPWNQTLSPGGSSGGSAAAVAAGLVPFAHASDGGGSIRIPAALCGLFGFKPSRGVQKVSRRTRQPADLSMEHCVSWSVRDSARLLSLTEQTSADRAIGFVTSPSDRRLKIGVITENFLGARPSAATRAAMQEAAALCETLGHHVSEARWPFDGDEFVEHFLTVWGAGAAAIAALVTEKTGKAPDDSILEPWTLGLAQEFLARPPEALPQTLAYFDRLTADSQNWFHSNDVFMSPVVHKEALPIGELAPTRPFAELRAAIVEFASYTAVHNVIGAPAMSVPLGQSDAGLPVGTQFWGRQYDDGLLLALAYELEAAKPWRDRRPEIAL